MTQLPTPPLSAGLVIYFCYGIFNSVQRKRLRPSNMMIETISGKINNSFKTDIIKEEKF